MYYKTGDQVTLVGRDYGMIKTGAKGVILGFVASDYPNDDDAQVLFEGMDASVRIHEFDLLGPGISFPYQIGDIVQATRNLFVYCLAGTTGVIKRIDIDDPTSPYYVSWDQAEAADWVTESWIAPVSTLNINPEISSLVDEILGGAGDGSEV